MPPDPVPRCRALPAIFANANPSDPACSLLLTRLDALETQAAAISAEEAAENALWMKACEGLMGD